MIKSKDIQVFIVRHWLEQHHCPYVCSNFSGAGWEECDVIAITSAGIVNEFEIKMSRSDFFADFKKTHKHNCYSKQVEGDVYSLHTNVPNKFYYCCPNGLIKEEEVPSYAGLIHFTQYQLKTHPGKTFTEFKYIKKAPYIHKQKVNHKTIERIAKTLSQRFAFGCSLMTYMNNRELERPTLLEETGSLEDLFKQENGE